MILNLIRNREVRRRKESQLAAERERGNESDPLERAELEGVVKSALDRLSGETRTLLVLHYYHGLSQAEVGRLRSL